MRLLRRAALVTGALLLAISVWTGISSARERESRDLDAALEGRAESASLALAAYFERARALTLLLSRNAVFQNYYSETRRRGGTRTGRAALDAPNAALAYVEQLYPTSIGEICFIDRSGAENARVVHGSPAHPHELSPDESVNPFFAPTFALEGGEVYQARPYVSPDTGEWVISNSAQVPSRSGPSRAIVHFEVTLESFRRELAASNLTTRIVEGTSGEVMIDSRYPQRPGAPLGRPTDRTLVVPVRTERRIGLSTLDDERLASVRVARDEHNDNEWWVVVSAPAPSGFALGGIGWSSAILMLGALATLGIAYFGFRSYQSELRHQALTDALTGLPNRTLLLDRLRHAILLARRSGTRGAVVILDLDRFKDVNDTLGHGYGDRLLTNVGHRLQSSARESDTVARLGGDEFAIVLPTVADPAAAEALVGRLVTALDDPVTLSGVSVHIDPSFGIALFPDHGMDAEELIQRADIAMYEAKRLRLDHALYDPAHDPHSERRLSMVVALKTAIEERELHLHYQPKVDIATGRVRGVEALARWEHPDLGPVSPLEFISVAEDTGLIRQLTSFVLDESLRQARLWLDAGRDLCTAINVSAQNVFDPALVTEISEALTRHGVPAERLKLEITESTVMVEPGRARAALEALRGMSISIAVDDYGTGHSALAYLKHLPIDEIKIDRGFVMGMATDATDAQIVRSTIDLGRSLGLGIVAEGVEDAATLEQLSALGCTQAQGFHISRPLPAPELDVWLDGTDGVLARRIA